MHQRHAHLRLRIVPGTVVPALLAASLSLHRIEAIGEKTNFVDVKKMLLVW